MSLADQFRWLDWTSLSFHQVTDPCSESCVRARLDPRLAAESVQLAVELVHLPVLAASFRELGAEKSKRDR